WRCGGSRVDRCCARVAVPDVLPANQRDAQRRDSASDEADRTEPCDAAAPGQGLFGEHPDRDRRRPRHVHHAADKQEAHQSGAASSALWRPVAAAPNPAQITKYPAANHAARPTPLAASAGPRPARPALLRTAGAALGNIMAVIMTVHMPSISAV